MILWQQILFKYSFKAASHFPDDSARSSVCLCPVFSALSFPGTGHSRFQELGGRGGGAPHPPAGAREPLETPVPQPGRGRHLTRPTGRRDSSSGPPTLEPEGPGRNLPERRPGLGASTSCLPPAPSSRAHPVPGSGQLPAQAPSLARPSFPIGIFLESRSYPPGRDRPTTAKPPRLARSLSIAGGEESKGIPRIF